MAEAKQIPSEGHMAFAVAPAAIGAAILVAIAGFAATTFPRNLRLESAGLGLICMVVAFALMVARSRDIQHNAEETRLNLEESERRFHAFMNHLSANAFMKDSAGRLIYMNSSDARMPKIRLEERLGKTNFDFMPRTVAERLRANDRMVLESNCAHQFTESIPDQEGNLRHWLTFKFPFPDRSGEVFLGGVSIEVTEMIQAQNALRESESRYRQIVEYAGDVIVRCDARGRVSYINEMGARVLKYSAARLRGRRALHLVRREDRRRVSDSFAANWFPARSTCIWRCRWLLVTAPNSGWARPSGCCVRAAYLAVFRRSRETSRNAAGWRQSYARARRDSGSSTRMGRSLTTKLTGKA